MQANHFRIGNLIDCSKINAGICTIDCIEENRIGVKETPPLWGYIGEDEFEPIPLTEEWLLKFGFEKMSTNEYWFGIIAKGKILHISLSGNVEIMGLNFNSIRLGDICKYVHQLQNLYFALTGEELKFN